FQMLEGSPSRRSRLPSRARTSRSVFRRRLRDRISLLARRRTARESSPGTPVAAPTLAPWNSDWRSSGTATASSTWVNSSARIREVAQILARARVVQRDRRPVRERPEGLELRVEERRPAFVVQGQQAEVLAEDAQRTGETQSVLPHVRVGEGLCLMALEPVER